MFKILNPGGLNLKMRWRLIRKATLLVSFLRFSERQDSPEFQSLFAAALEEFQLFPDNLKLNPPKPGEMLFLGSLPKNFSRRQYRIVLSYGTNREMGKFFPPGAIFPARARARVRRLISAGMADSSQTSFKVWKSLPGKLVMYGR